MNLVLSITLKPAVILLCALSVTAFARRHSASTRHMILVIGLISALVLPVAASTLPKWDLPLLAPWTQPAPPAALKVNRAITSGLNVSELSKEKRYFDETSKLSCQNALLVLWTAGFLFFLTRLVLGIVAVSRIYSNARRTGETRDPRVPIFTADGSFPPMTWGIFKSVVLMPSASRRWSDERKLAIRQSRLNASQAVVQAIKAAVKKPAVVIQASGIGYYGPGDDEEITEDTPPGHDFLAKLAVDWEASTSSLESLGIRRAVIRTGVVLSNEGQALLRMLMPFRFFVGGRLGSGRQWFPWIHVADEVGAIRFLIENNAANGPFNLVAPVSINNAGFSRLLGRQLKRPALIPTPSFALRLLFGEMATIILDGQRAVPKRLLQLGYSFRFPDAAQALSDLLS